MSSPDGSPGRTPEFVAVVGNPRAGSRTAALAVATLHAIADLIAGPAGAADPGTADPGTAESAGQENRAGTNTAVIDLAELLVTAGTPFGVDAPRRYAEPLNQLRSARLLVVATPTYKASYTGLLKSFLDHVAAGALAGIVAVPVVTAGSPAHFLAADVHLRPLLLELGAVCPTSALVVGEDRLADPAAAIESWLVTAAPTLTRWFGPLTGPVELAAAGSGAGQRRPRE